MREKLASISLLIVMVLSLGSGGGTASGFSRLLWDGGAIGTLGQKIESLG